MFVDIHNHVVPGVDDGAQTIGDSLAMIDQALQSNISMICATPHIHGDVDELGNHERHKHAFAALMEELDKRSYTIDMRLGCEIYCTTDIAKVATHREFSYCEDKKYLLVELPATEAPHYFGEMIFQIKLEGITPVLAHPERNMALMRKPEILAQYIKMGILTQVTTGSLAGDFGEQIQEFAKRIVRANACTILASDAHNTGRRPFTSFPKAYAIAAELVGEWRAKSICSDNPKAIIEAKPVYFQDFDEEAEKTLLNVKKKRFFFF